MNTKMHFCCYKSQNLDQQIEIPLDKVDILIVAGNSRSLIANRQDLIKDWKKMGLSVAALVPRQDYLDEVEQLRIKIFKIDLSRVTLNPFKDFLSILALSKLIKTIEPKTVFAYNLKPIVYGSIAAKIAGVKKIFSIVTGLGFVFTTKNLKTKILRFLVSSLYFLALKFNNCVFFQNPDDIKEFLVRNIISKKTKVCRIYGSGINLDVFKQLPPVLKPISFICIARLIKEKGILEFCEAARIVKEQYPEGNFYLIGGYDETLPGAITYEVFQQIKQDNYVTAVGKIEDVKPWLEKCSVFVMPSYYREGTPRAVLEAMSVGRPIITCNTPGCKETVVEGENGFLVPPRQIEPLVECMKKFISQPELIVTMGKASRQIAEQLYDVHKVNKKINQAMGLIK